MGSQQLMGLTNFTSGLLATSGMCFFFRISNNGQSIHLQAGIEKMKTGWLKGSDLPNRNNTHWLGLHGRFTYLTFRRLHRHKTTKDDVHN